MFERWKSKPRENPKEPTFQELRAALPPDLQEEFDLVSQRVRQIADLHGAAMDGNEFDDSLLSEEERQAFDRRMELDRIAMQNLKGGE